MENQHNNSKQLERQTTNLPTSLSEAWTSKQVCRIFEKTNEVVGFNDVNYFLARKRERLFCDLSEAEKNLNVSGVLSAFFGCNPDNVSTLLIASILERISSQYGSLTVQDYLTAFNRKEIIKRQGVAMTVGEFFEPINEWISICNKISSKIQNEINKQQEEERLRKLSLEEYERERQLMLNHFEELKRNGKTTWDKSDIDALKISKIVSKGILSVDEKKEIYENVVNSEMEKRKIENPLSKLDLYLEMLGNQQLASYEIRFKCAKIVVERCLEFHLNNKNK